MGALADRVCYFCRRLRPGAEFVSAKRFAGCADCRDKDLRGRTRGGLGLSQRPRTESVRTMRVSLHVVDDYPKGVERPRTRGECVDGPRPCPWVSCKYHLALDVKPNGSVQTNHPDRELEDMAETCALDVADSGGATLDYVARALNVTRQRIQQMEQDSFALLRHGPNPADDGERDQMHRRRNANGKLRRLVLDEDAPVEPEERVEAPEGFWERIAYRAYRALVSRAFARGEEPRRGKWNDDDDASKVAGGDDDA